MIKVYEYDKCSTCKNALKFLDAKKVSYKRFAIVETPPAIADLRKMLAAQQNDMKKLFNTSGQMYRELGISEKLPKMSETEALELLSKHGKLVKRPFVIGDTVALVGFKEDEWKQTFSI